MSVVTLTIDGQEVGADSDQTILDVAKAHSIHIPTMCFLEGLTPWGGCRICVVDVEGAPRPLSSCTTHVTDGMVVTTTTKRLEGYRKMTLEMLYAEGNHTCSVCVSNGHCELQDKAVEVKMDHVRLPYLNQHLTMDSTHKHFGLDQNRCILCTRCVRVCSEIEGAQTWAVAGRGVDSHIVSDLGTPWGESDSCTSCGKCVQVCPTGALVNKGNAVNEQTKKFNFLEYLQEMRGQQ